MTSRTLKPGRLPHPAPLIVWLWTIMCFLMVSGVATAVDAGNAGAPPVPESGSPAQTSPPIEVQQDQGDTSAKSNAGIAPSLPRPSPDSREDARAGAAGNQTTTGLSPELSPEMSAITQALRGILEQPEAKTDVVAENPKPSARGSTKRGRQAEVDKLYAEAATQDRAALAEFYATRHHAPIWLTQEGPTNKARALLEAISEAPAYGLEPDLIPVPDLSSFTSNSGATPSSRAEMEIALSMAALTYARHARGGRIPKPAELLNTNLDRKPQLHSPMVVMTDLADADDMRAALARLHPVHPQFEKLRQAFLKETGGNGQGKLSAKAKRIRANMEFWRWMWDDLGELYVFNNLPEYMQYVVREGRVVRESRIVVGEVSKQSSVFSRPLKEVVLRPRWRVPESIMVRELWPSLRGSGSLMRRYGLEITTKSGEPRNWREIDWHKDDIRNYHVWQAPGRKSVLGFVKFSFPSQHTIFMHDTPDKWMFNRGRRTLSHGCLRVKNPMGLTEIVLAHDQGWDSAKIKRLIRSGPLDNKVHMTRHIPIHLAYFTAWVRDDGKLRFFSDIYGHEKRVRQALDGDWEKIRKGRNHLAKPRPNFKKRNKVANNGAASQRKTKQPANVTDMISNALGF